MEKISIFGADFERSKKIVTNGKFALTAGMPNPIHMGIINRLLRVIFGIFIFFGVMVYFLLIALPSGLGLDGDLHYISYDSTVLVRSMGAFLEPISLLLYVTYLLASILVFWSKKHLSSQVFTYFSWGSTLFISGLYFASAVTYDAYTMVGVWLQIVVGIVLFIWIIVNKIQNLKRYLNDEDKKPLLMYCIPKIRFCSLTFGVQIIYIYHLFLSS